MRVLTYRQVAKQQSRVQNRTKSWLYQVGFLWFHMRTKHERRMRWEKEAKRLKSLKSGTLTNYRIIPKETVCQKNK